MNRNKIVTMIVAMIFILSCGVAMAEEAPKKVKDLANSALAKLGTDPIIVSAVKAENAKGKTLDQIKAMDAKWKATPGIADYMQALSDSECGKHIRKIANSTPFYAEIFIMDNQGANVSMTDKTSDYWQGDEAKFQKSYNAGKGAVFVDDVEFDDSVQAYLCQVSVPVMDGAEAIGAITIGIDVEKIE